jgi:hypothetical protein
MTDELISNGYSLDISDTIPIPVSYAIADVKEPSKRKKSYSKEITLPATMNNNAFFAGSFRLTSNDSIVNFDATAKAEIVLKKRGVVVLKGLIKLNSVVINDGVPSYKCQIFSESVDIFLLLQNIMVSELDWSAYNHTLSRTNIKNSWTATAGSGYYYPLIDRRPRLGATIWNTTDLVPYVYVRETLLKCFELVGLTWDSNFLDSSQFKNILFGYGGGEIRTLPPAELNNRKVLIDNGNYILSKTMNGGTVYMNVGNPFDPDNQFSTFTSTETQDLYNQYELGEITIQRAGDYTMDINLVLDYSITTDNIFNSFYAPELVCYKNGNPYYTISPTSYSNVALSGTLTFDENASTVITAESGDIFTFKFRAGIISSYTDYDDPAYYNGQPPFTLDMSTNALSPTSIHLTCNNSTITDGETVLLNQFLPSMKCSDFMLNCIRQFNLYISDPSESGVCKIEPLSDYYQQTNVFTDITDIVDNDKEIQIRPSANEFKKNILFQFKKQNHYDFEQYFNKWNVEYNNLNQVQGSYYAKGDYKVDLTWATIIPYEVSSGILVPRFIKIENNTVKPNNGDPIICFRNGSKTGAWTFKDTVGSGQEVLTTYPCIHHFNNWTNPTFDLSFQLTNELYYIANKITTNNCYSTYYFDFVNEMTNRAGQIVKLYVYWKALDVRNLDFSKFLMINGALFRLNEVNEFAPESEDSTQIELIKVLKAKKKNRQNLTIPRVAPVGVGMASSPVGVGIDTGVSSGGKDTVLVYSNLSKG